MYSKAFLTCVQGTDQSVDERILPPDRFKVTNGYFDKSSRVRKRHGFTPVTRTSDDDDTIMSGRVLFSTGHPDADGELCLISERNLYGHNTTWERWVDKGLVSPCIGDQRPLYVDEVSCDQADMASDGTYVLYLGRRLWAEGEEFAVAADQRADLVYTIKAGTGETVVAPPYTGLLSATAASSKVHAVSAGHCDDNLIALCATGLSTPGTLHRYYWDTSSPSVSAPTAGSNITTDLWIAGHNIRTYHQLALQSGDYVVAYIDDTNRAINLVRYNSSHVSQATSTISSVEGEEFKRVALAEDSAAGVLAVLATHHNSGAGDQTVIYGRDNSTLGADWGPVTLDTAPNDPDFVDNIGVMFHKIPTANLFTCTWTEHDSAWDEAIFTYASITTDGVNSTAPQQRWNLVTKSQPFERNARAYVHCDTTVGSDVYQSSGLASYHSVQTAAIECSCLMELVVDPGSSGHGAGTGEEHLAAIFNVGSAPMASGGNAYRLGNGATVVGNIAGEGSSYPRFCTLWNTYNLRQGSTILQTHAASEMVLDFLTPPGVAVISNGVAAIGGGFVGWYDGSRTCELGHAVMPVPQIPVPSNGVGNLSNSTSYGYQAYWSSYDASGVQHRSIPSFQISVTTGASDDTVELQARQNPATLRVNQQRVDCVWYRVKNSIPKQVSEPTRFTGSPNGQFETESFFDVGQDLGPAIYIQSREIEAVCPEGARLPVVVGGRLWLGDLFRRDRVQYSKVFTPGTGNDTALAPEFNEGFGYTLENGQSVTAMAGLDDKAIVFTRDAIFQVAGQGPADDGSANDFSGLVPISTDAGCIDARSVANTPEGIVFQSRAGIYLLGRGGATQYIGKAVEDDLGSYSVITSAVLVASLNQVRFTCIIDSGQSAGTARSGASAIILVYDYRIKQWARWDCPYGGSTGACVPVSACLHGDDYYLLEPSGHVWKYDTSTYYDDTDQWFEYSVESGWIQTAHPHGWQRVRKLSPTLEAEGTCTVRLETFHDFDNTTATQSHDWTTTVLQNVSGSTRMQPIMHLKRQKCSAVKLRVSDNETGATGSGNSFTMAGLGVEFMPKRGQVKMGSGNRN